MYIIVKPWSTNKEREETGNCNIKNILLLIYSYCTYSLPQLSANLNGEIIKILLLK